MVLSIHSSGRYVLIASVRDFLVNDSFTAVPVIRPRNPTEYSRPTTVVAKETGDQLWVVGPVSIPAALAGDRIANHMPIHLVNSIAAAILEVATLLEPGEQFGF